MHITETSLARAVEITKAAITGNNAPWISNGDSVADFIEKVATKLEELRSAAQPQR